MMADIGITLLGLGPGDPGLLTRHAWDLINSTKIMNLMSKFTAK